MDVEDIHNVYSSSPTINAPSMRIISVSKPSILKYCIEKCTERKNAAAVLKATTELDNYYSMLEQLKALN